MTSISQQSSSWKDRHSAEASFRPRMSLVSLCYSILLNLIWRKVHCNYFHIIFGQHGIAQNFISAQQFQKEGQTLLLLVNHLKANLVLNIMFLDECQQAVRGLFNQIFYRYCLPPPLKQSLIWKLFHPMSKEHIFVTMKLFLQSKVPQNISESNINEFNITLYDSGTFSSVNRYDSTSIISKWWPNKHAVMQQQQ